MSGNLHMCWFSTTILWSTGILLRGYAYRCDEKVSSSELALKIAMT